MLLRVVSIGPLDRRSPRPVLQLSFALSIFSITQTTVLLLGRSSPVGLSRKGHLEADALGIEEFIESALPRYYGAAWHRATGPFLPRQGRQSYRPAR